MGSVISILSYLVDVAVFVLFVMVLLKLFKKEGALKGVLGLICALYTFVWGWMHNKDEGITQIMWIWTGLIILTGILTSIGTALTAAAAVLQ